MSQKASSLPRQNPFRRFISSIQERSKETKDSDLQDGSVVASVVVLATPSECTARSLMTARDASQPAQFSPVPATMELRSPNQVTSPPLVHLRLLFSSQRRRFLRFLRRLHLLRQRLVLSQPLPIQYPPPPQT
jgi:hypothetical protein